MNAKLSKVNQSIEITIQIVEVMARGKGPMRLQDVAKKCGMPASTVMRMLNTLQVYGYVNQDACTQHYSLSLRFARLGCLVSEQTNMRDVARPFLAELAQRCQETVCLGCEAEMEVECTDVVDGPDGILMVSQRVGARAPLHATGAGKLLLLNYSNQKLNEYIGNGQPWDLDRLHGGVHTLPPYEQAKGTDWYKGTANAIYQNIGFIDSYDPEYVIILSGDQICKQDYADFLRFHKEKGAEFSVAVMEVDWKEASRFGLMVADENDRITEFQEKPPVPKSNLASMGIYIFNWDVLKKYLEEDEADPNSKNDFGMNIIPALLRDGRKMYAYRFAGYWRDVGTIDSLWEANMEVLDPENSGIDIFDEKWKIYSRNPVLPPQKIGPRAVVQDSLVTEGCKIYGNVHHSVLSAGVVVEEGATVEDAVLMDGVVVKAGAVVKLSLIHI